jgi:DNA-binding MarR family transcriptional regulator
MSYDPDRTAEDILLALRRIMRSMDIASRQLICLQNLQEQGPLTTGKLAEAVSLSPATVTGILDRMERRGLITRERRPEDKRRVLVAVTAAGQSAAEAAPSYLAKRLAQSLERLPEAERAEIQRVILYLAEWSELRDDAK